MEDVKFHQCVRLSRFENDRTVSVDPRMSRPLATTLMHIYPDIFHPARWRVRADELPAEHTCETIGLGGGRRTSQPFCGYEAYADDVRLFRLNTTKALG